MELLKACSSILEHVDASDAKDAEDAGAWDVELSRAF